MKSESGRRWTLATTIHYHSGQHHSDRRRLPPNQVLRVDPVPRFVLGCQPFGQRMLAPERNLPGRSALRFPFEWSLGRPGSGPWARPPRKRFAIGRRRRTTIRIHGKRNHFVRPTNRIHGKRKHFVVRRHHHFEHVVERRPERHRKIPIGQFVQPPCRRCSCREHRRHHAFQFPLRWWKFRHFFFGRARKIQVKNQDTQKCSTTYWNPFSSAT